MKRTFFCLSGVLAMVLAVGCGRGSGLGTQTPVCGNGELESGELCDASDLGGATCGGLNLGTGELGCATDCTFDVSGCSEQAVCGNYEWEYPEDCDGADLHDMTCEALGYSGGTLSCASSCTFDTHRCEAGGECGNGEREAGEECDGSDVGGVSCADLGLGTGSVGCTAECHYNVSGCSAQAACGNGAIEYPEVCDGADLNDQTCGDQGFYNGLLSCAADCLTFDTSSCFGRCGDAELNGPEVCDGSLLDGESCRSQGYYGGELACAADCVDFDYTQCGGTCGDGEVNGPERCDTNDFDGDSCQARGFYQGSLTCSNDCARVDESGCSEYCGDGVINGSEVCDLTAVGGDTCENHNLEGTLRCLPDCSGINLASCIASDLLLTEVGLGYPDFIEITNVGTNPIDLDGWVLEWFGVDGGTSNTGQWTLPAYTLAAGDRVVIQDDYYGNPQDPPTVDTTNHVIVVHENLPWTTEPGAVTLWTPNADPVDFVRWTDATYAPPTGTAWADTPGPVVAMDSTGKSISRVPDLQDTDTAGDWCRTNETPGAANGACLTNTHPPGTLLITEVLDEGQTDHVELYNAGNAAVDLDGFILYVIYTAQQADWVPLPAFSLAGNAYVEIVDDAGNNPASVDTNGVIHTPNLNIATASGSIRLLEPDLEEGVDFVRWGGSTYDPVAPDTWADTPSALPAMTQGESLGRSSLTDTDTAADWCNQTPTLGVANASCN